MWKHSIDKSSHADAGTWGILLVSTNNYEHLACAWQVVMNLEK